MLFHVNYQVEAQVRLGAYLPIRSAHWQNSPYSLYIFAVKLTWQARQTCTFVIFGVKAFGQVQNTPLTNEQRQRQFMGRNATLVQGWRERPGVVAVISACFHHWVPASWLESLTGAVALNGMIFGHRMLTFTLTPFCNLTSNVSTTIKQWHRRVNTLLKMCVIKSYLKSYMHFLLAYSFWLLLLRSKTVWSFSDLYKNVAY